MFPDSSTSAFNFALITGVSDMILWCDVQLTSDNAGICLPYLNIDNGTTISSVFDKGKKTYPVNGVPMTGWFPVDFSLKDLENVLCKFNFLCPIFLSIYYVYIMIGQCNYRHVTCITISFVKLT